MKKRIVSCLFSLLLGLIFWGVTSCSQEEKGKKGYREWIERNGKIKVLSTIGMIDDIVQKIGKDHVDSMVLVKGDLDPHSYELVKGDGEKLEFADLVFYNGLGLEHGPSLKHILENSSKAHALGNKVREKYPDLILEEFGHVDPHIWMDISLWMHIVPFIVEELSNVDPKNREEYSTNGKRLLEEMQKTHQVVYRKLQELPQEKRYLITSHDAFNYFTRRYLAAPDETKIDQWKARFQAPEGFSPESQISTHEIQKIIDHMTEYQVFVLFPESNVSKDSLKKIVDACREKGIEITMTQTALYGDAMGPAGSSGDSYLKMIEHNAANISKHLMRQRDDISAKP